MKPYSAGVSKVLHCSTLPLASPRLGHEYLFAGVGLVGADAGDAVGLQFNAHARRVRLRFAGAAEHAVDLIGHADELLHVMSTSCAIT